MGRNKCQAVYKLFFGIMYKCAVIIKKLDDKVDVELRHKLKIMWSKVGKPAIVTLCVFLVILGLLEEEYTADDDIRNSRAYPVEAVGKRVNTSLRNPLKPVVYLASVICSARLEEGLTMLRTAIFFARDANLYLIVFSDLQNRNKLANRLEELTDVAEKIKVHVDYELHLVYINPSEGAHWHYMFAPCSAQRLFFPLTLKHIDHLMYVDTDVMFLSSITDLWKEFDKMKPFQMAAVAPEHELPGDGWYNRKSLIPYYGPRGLNTGVMLMNLTAMRSFDFLENVISISSKYADTIKWADQDMLNILFKFYPSTLHEIGCEFNYRVQHCKCDWPGTGDCGCKFAEKNGISIFHGNRKKFHREPFIANIYNSFRLMDMTESPKKLFYTMMSDYNDLDSSLQCTNISSALFTKFQKYVNRF